MNNEERKHIYISGSDINSNQSFLGSDIRKMCEDASRQPILDDPADRFWRSVGAKYYTSMSKKVTYKTPRDDVYYFIKSPGIVLSPTTKGIVAQGEYVVLVRDNERSPRKCNAKIVTIKSENEPNSGKPKPIGNKKKPFHIPDTAINNNISYRGYDIKAMCKSKAKLYESKEMYGYGQSSLFWYLMYEKYYKEYDVIVQPKVPSDKAYYFIKSPGAVINMDEGMLVSIGKSYYLKRDLKRSPIK